MKRILFLLLIVLGCSVQAQDRYASGMERALGLWQDGNPWEAVNLLERITKAEPEKWIPPFYLAQINILESFNEKDEARLSAQLGKAKHYLELAQSLSPQNPEILVLEAQMLTAWVVFDGDRFGMSYSPRIAALYEQAARIAPDNPRVVLGKAQWDIGSARFFGQSTQPFCDDIRRAIALFEQEPEPENFEPRGSVQHARSVLAENCDKE